MEQKNFDSWNTMKKKVHLSERRLFVKEREVWWCALGVNVGNEQDGVGEHFERPCVIVKGFSPTTYLILPLSTKKKIPRFQIEVMFKSNTINYALLDQIRVIDIKRLRRKIGQIPIATFDNIMSSLRAIF